MTRELARLEVYFTSVNIKSSFATYSKSRNKPQILDVATENNLSPTQVAITLMTMGQLLL